MPYPTLITILRGADRAQVDAAAAAAQAWDAHLQVLCANTEPLDVAVWPTDAGAALQAAVLQEAEAELEAVEATVAQWLTGRSLRWSTRRLSGFAGQVRGVAAAVARFADLGILPFPTRQNGTAEVRLLLETLLFEARLPVLLTARRLDPAMRRIVIAWDGSPSGLSAARAALPLLRRADTVDIVMIDPPSHPAETADPGAELATFLQRHGVPAEITMLPRTLPRISEVLVRHARDTDADLIVMGAYGHSRLREAVFGGVTRDMIGGDGQIPVLLAH
ncbi:MAG: universal stress protein [Tranquillimonas sp.]